MSDEVQTEETLTFDIPVCPNPHKTVAIEYNREGNRIDLEDNPFASTKINEAVEAEDDQPATELTQVITVKICPIKENCSRSNLCVIVKVCPERVDDEPTPSGACQCAFCSDVNWEELGESAYNPHIKITWVNPDKCLLKRIELQKYNFFDGFTSVYTQQLADVTGNWIYPRGDKRNASCVGCGIGGDNNNPAGDREISRYSGLMPGQAYVLFGWFNTVDCGEAEIPKLIGYAVYETAGFSSGQIGGKMYEDPPIYSVRRLVNNDKFCGIFKYKYANHYASDMYAWQPGDPVMLTKGNTTHPGVANNSKSTMPIPETDAEYVIAPYNKSYGTFVFGV